MEASGASSAGQHQGLAAGDIHSQPRPEEGPRGFFGPDRWPIERKKKASLGGQVPRGLGEVGGVRARGLSLGVGRSGAWDRAQGAWRFRPLLASGWGGWMEGTDVWLRGSRTLAGGLCCSGHWGEDRMVSQVTGDPWGLHLLSGLSEQGPSFRDPGSRDKPPLGCSVPVLTPGRGTGQGLSTEVLVLTLEHHLHEKPESEMGCAAWPRPPGGQGRASPSHASSGVGRGAGPRLARRRGLNEAQTSTSCPREYPPMGSPSGSRAVTPAHP